MKKCLTNQRSSANTPPSPDPSPIVPPPHCRPLGPPSALSRPLTPYSPDPAPLLKTPCSAFPQGTHLSLEPVSLFLLSIAGAFLAAMVIGAVCMCVQSARRTRAHFPDADVSTGYTTDTNEFLDELHALSQTEDEVEDIEDQYPPPSQGRASHLPAYVVRMPGPCALKLAYVAPKTWREHAVDRSQTEAPYAPADGPYDVELAAQVPGELSAQESARLGGSLGVPAIATRLRTARPPPPHVFQVTVPGSGGWYVVRSPRLLLREELAHAVASVEAGTDLVALPP